MVAQKEKREFGPELIITLLELGILGPLVWHDRILLMWNLEVLASNPCHVGYLDCFVRALYDYTSGREGRGRGTQLRPCFFVPQSENHPRTPRVERA